MTEWSQAAKGPTEERVTLATQFCETMHMLLSVVPLSSILAVSDTVMADVDEDEGVAQPSTSTSNELHYSTIEFVSIVCQHVMLIRSHHGSWIQHYMHTCIHMRKDVWLGQQHDTHAVTSESTALASAHSTPPCHGCEPISSIACECST